MKAYPVPNCWECPLRRPANGGLIPKKMCIHQKWKDMGWAGRIIEVAKAKDPPN